MVKITFKKAGLDDITIDVAEGTTILEAAHANGADLEGSCEGSLACSTCHVILEQEYYDKLEEPSDDENDMLDMAFGLSKTSRLGCQVKITKDLEGATFVIPTKTRNVQS
jgi:ferredoxin